MKLRRTCAVLFAWSLAIASHAQLKPDGTLGDLLNGYLGRLAAGCPKQAAAVAEAKAKGEIGAIIVSQQLFQSMCVCHPAKARALLASLPAAKLSAPAEGDNAFASVATPGIQEPCLREQLHSMFEGKTCDGFKSTDIQNGTEEAAFCACMKKDLAHWDTADLFRQLGPYNAKFRMAKSSKTPRPQRTPLVDRYVHSLTACGGGGEFKD